MSSSTGWEKHYPIKQSDEQRVNRRQFAVFCGCSAIALGAGIPMQNRLRAIPRATEPVAVAEVGEVPHGGYKLFHYPSEHHPCILIRLKTGDYAAYSQSCTHLMCPVHFDVMTNQLVCPCHNGYFSASDGAVVAGPPQRPLPRYEVNIAEGMIWVGPDWEGEKTPTLSA